MSGEHPRQLAGHARAIEVCAYCPGLCRFACPVEEVEGREAASPRLMVSLLHHMQRGVFPWGEDAARAMTFCDGCGACTEVCQHQNPVHGMLLAGRAVAHGRGLTDPGVRAVVENLAAGLGPGGGVLTAPLRDVHPERQGVEAPVLLWPSDRALEVGPESLQATCDFLRRAGVEFALPPPDSYRPSALWARELGAEALEEDLRRGLLQATAGYGRVFFEEPAELALGIPRPEVGISWWDLAGEGGLRADVDLRWFSRPRAFPPGFDGLAGSLGLRDLAGHGGPVVSSGGAAVYDLVNPASARALRARFAERARGDGVLVPSPWIAHWLREGGVVARAPAELVPRAT